MLLSSLISTACIRPNLASTTKDEVLLELLDAVNSAHPLHKRETVLELLRSREELQSTGIGEGIAIPHTKTNQVDDFRAAFGISREGVEFGALDGKPSYFFFLLLAPENAANRHLQLLARIARIFKDSEVRERIKHATAAEQIASIISEAEGRLP